MALLNKSTEEVWSFQTDQTIMWLGEDGILRYDYVPPYQDEKLEEAERVAAEVLKRTQGKRYPMLVNLVAVRSSTPEARAFHAGPETGKFVSACAVMVKTTLARVIGSFFLGLNRPSWPVKLFTDEDEAVAWLKDGAHKS